MAEDTMMLTMWTVYHRPADYPSEQWVARRFEVTDKIKATADMYTAESLIELRTLLPCGLHRMERWPEDDPTIVEVWL